MNNSIVFLKCTSLIGVILTSSACAELQQSFSLSDSSTDEEIAAVQSVEAQKSARKARFARLEAEDDVPVTSVKLAASANSNDNASQGGGIVSQNDPPPSNIVAKNSSSGSGGASIGSQQSVDLNAGKFLNRGGGITSQQKPTFASP